MWFLFLLGIIVIIVIVVICAFKPDCREKLERGLRKCQELQDLERGRVPATNDRQNFDLDAYLAKLHSAEERSNTADKNANIEIIHPTIDISDDGLTGTDTESDVEIEFTFTPQELDKNGKPTKIGEHMCRIILETFFQLNFASDWHTILNPQSGRYLELDCYCSKYKLALEFHGAQHYERVAKFQRTEADFHKQQWNDRLKILICKKLRITLIVVDGRNNYDAISNALRALLDGREYDEDIISIPSHPERLPHLLTKRVL